MEKAILEKISGYSEYAIDLQRSLVAIPAIAPESGGVGELEKTEWLEKELRKLPFDSFQRIDAPQPEAKGGIRPNLIARYKGVSSAKTFWIMSHTDIVPPGDLLQWRTNPYVLHVENGKLFGRGTEDNHQGLVGSILCVKAMMECGYRPPIDIGLLFAADEETGSGFGADFIVKNYPRLFGKNDMFVVPDAGLPDASLVEVAEKSIMWLKIKTKGKQCHASTPELGKNAFRAASELVVKLSGLYGKFNKENKLFGPPISTFEPTKKEANVLNVNTIPGEDVFFLDSRVLPEYSLKDVKHEIRKYAREVERARDVTISFEVVQEGEAAPPTPADADVVKAIIVSVKEIYPGAAPKALGIGGGTVAACFRHLGLPAVVYSKLDEIAHQPNEYCILDNLIGDAKVFALAAMRIKA